MEFFLKVFYGILLFAAGIVLIKYRKQVYDWTGRFAWAEHYIGSGGTVLVIILTGLILMFIGVSYPSGIFDGPFSNKNAGDKLYDSYSNTNDDTTSQK